VRCFVRTVTLEPQHTTGMLRLIGRVPPRPLQVNTKKKKNALDAIGGRGTMHAAGGGGGGSGDGGGGGRVEFQRGRA
jgi:hypothetical protein